MELYDRMMDSYDRIMKYIVPAGRLLFAFIFLKASFGHFTQSTITYAANAGVPMANILAPFSGVLCLVGGLSILLGLQARWGAWMIVLFLVPVTLTMHKFWGLEDPAKAGMQQINFMKNASLCGAALMIAYLGSGPLSLDALIWRRPTSKVTKK